MKQYVLHKGMSRDRLIDAVAGFLRALPLEKAWSVKIEEHVRRRSCQQNAYLWGVVYPTILREGGEALRGWTADDLHEYFLGEHFGWEVLEGLGRKRMKPIRRSSKLSTVEFMDFIGFIQRRMAEQGVYIPDPNEQVAA